MKKIIISLLIIFSTNCYSQDNSSELLKEKYHKYIEYLAKFTGSSFVCGGLHEFFIGNVNTNGAYITATRHIELEYSKEEKDELFNGYRKIIKDIISEDDLDSSFIKRFGGCDNIFKEIQKSNNVVKYSELYWDKDINLTSTNSYLGMKLKTDIRDYVKTNNGKIINLKPTGIPMISPSYEIIPPQTNSLFNKYEVWGYHDEEVGHLIKTIIASHDRIGLKSCLEKQQILFEHYKNNSNAKFIVNVAGLNHVTIDQFKLYSIEEMMWNEVRIWMEFDNNDESVQFACLIDGYNKLRKIPLYDFNFIIFLVDKNKRRTDILEGL